MSDTTLFPPSGPVTFQTVIASYLYKQYEDDDDLQTFVASQNYLAQKWLDDFNNLNLPIWSALSGNLLDWVGAGLYGIQRPILSYQQPAPVGAGSGPYNTMPWNTSVYNGGRLHPANTNPVSYLPVTDDIYQRILTWHLYLGDGFQFSTKWLKRRVHRFINGSNGYLPIEDNTYDVSISATGTAVTIEVTENSIGTVFQYAVTDGVLALPFQFTYTVSPTIVTIPNTGGGALQGAAAIRGYYRVRGLSSATVAGAGGISGSISVLAGTRLLVATAAAVGSLSGDAAVLHNGAVTWPLTGRVDGSGSVTGRSNTRGAMGGILPGTAG
ncbi:MAG TPA: hypothetical protein VGM38_09310 [Pseudolysinimonas sp.]|jgi:hypothetical protein